MHMIINEIKFAPNKSYPSNTESVKFACTKDEVPEYVSRVKFYDCHLQLINKTVCVQIS